MRKSFIASVNILAAGLLLAVGSGAQQTPASSTPQTQTQKPSLKQQSQSQAPATTPAPPAPATAPPTPPTVSSVAVPGLDTDNAKVGYALGMSVGTALKRQGVELDEPTFDRGFRDAFLGPTTLMTEDQLKTILTAFQAEMRQKQQERARVAAEKNKQEGAAFLEGNKSKEGVVVLPSGLQYKILTAGTGPKPTSTDTVICNYRGTLIDGTEFDSSYKRGQPTTFPVTGVIKGWTEALELMPVGSKWQLWVPPDLAYGERGAGSAIGPNSTLIFEVELVSIKEKPQPGTPAAPATPPPSTTPPGDATQKPQ